MARLISNSAPRRLTASSAIGEIGCPPCHPGPFSRCRPIRGRTTARRHCNSRTEGCAESGQMLLGMLASPVARGVIDRRRRRRPGKRTVVARKGPYARGRALACGLRKSPDRISGNLRTGLECTPQTETRKIADSFPAREETGAWPDGKELLMRTKSWSFSSAWRRAKTSASWQTRLASVANDFMTGVITSGFVVI